MRKKAGLVRLENAHFIYLLYIYPSSFPCRFLCLIPLKWTGKGEKGKPHSDGRAP